MVERTITTPSPSVEVVTTGPPEEALMGISLTGKPTVRHDGIAISAVRPKGPADDIDLKPGDVILAIDDHYLYTINELRAELLRHKPGVRVRIHYRHYLFINENYLTIGSQDPVSSR